MFKDKVKWKIGSRALIKKIESVAISNLMNTFVIVLIKKSPHLLYEMIYSFFLPSKDFNSVNSSA